MGTRRDPRVDSEDQVEDHSVERVVVPTHIQPPPSSRRIELPPDASEDETPEAPPSAPPARVAIDSSKALPAKGPLVDAIRFERVGQRLDQNDWGALAEELGPLEDEKKLPRTFALLAAIAHNERTLEGHPGAIDVASRAVSDLLGTPLDSPVTRIVARRLLRKNRIRLRDRQAPRASLTAIIIVSTALVGAGIGLLFSGGWSLIRPYILGH